MGSKPWNEPMTNADELLTDSCGGNRDRTDDLLHAMQALSQLSYTPTQWQPTPIAHHPKCPPPQLEPQITSRLSAVFQTRQSFFAPHEFEQGIARWRVGRAHGQNPGRHCQLGHLQALAGQHLFEGGCDGWPVPFA